jgi:hypothetical protein
VSVTDEHVERTTPSQVSQTRRDLGDPGSDSRDYSPRNNSEIVTPNPFDNTSSIGKQVFFLPRSKSEMCPRSTPKR